MSTAFPTGSQYGFFFDESRCIDCRACVIACLDWYNIPAGPVKLARMFSWEEGTYPTLKLHLLFAPCYHCANPVCVSVANGAMIKEGDYGAVLVNTNQANNPSLRAAAAACPYGAIAFDSDAPNANAFKCTMCIDRLAQGKLPACVAACPMRALDFDTLANLKKKYGTNQQLTGMPDPSATQPSVVFKPQNPKTQLVPYDATYAIQLMMNRPNGLPAVFNGTTALTGTSSSDVGRGTLNLIAKSTNDFIKNTQNDES